MATTRIISGTQKRITNIRALFPPGAALAKRKNHPITLVNPELCDRVLDRLDLSGYKNTHILDMNPAMGLWSSKLHERLQPRQHTLLEPEEVYTEALKEFTRDHKNSYHVPLDGYMWDTYTSLFGTEHPTPPFPPDFPGFDVKKMDPGEGVNKDLLFVGYLGGSGRGERLIAQFLNCCAVGSWVQSFGRVRFLVWISDSIKERFLPRSIAARGRPAVIAEAVADIVEVAGSNIVRSGRGFFKRPEVDETNLDLEAQKKAPTKRQEAKVLAEIKARKFEEEVERLATQMLGFPAKRKRGRPKKLAPEEQEKVDKVYKKAREEAEKVRAAILKGLTPQQKFGEEVERPDDEVLEPRPKGKLGRLKELTPEEERKLASASKKARKKVEKVRATILEDLNSKQKFEEEVERLAAEMLGTQPNKRGRPKKLTSKEQKEVKRVYKKAREEAKKVRATILESLTSQQKFEEEVERLAAEMLGIQPKRKLGRPLKLTPEEQEGVDNVYKEVREEATKVRAANLESPQQMLLESPQQTLEAPQQIPEEEREGEEGLVGLSAEGKAAEGKAEPGGKRGPATKVDLVDQNKGKNDVNEREKVREVMANLKENPGVWVPGMEHPPWYYKTAEKQKALAREIVRNAATAPAAGASKDLSAHIKELGDSASSQSFETTEVSTKNFEEFEARWMKRPEITARNISREDEIIAIRGGLLKYYQRPYNPVVVDPETDIYPHAPLTLLDITPKIPDPYFSSASPDEREELWLTFDWLVRNIFVLRASTIRQSLRHVAPGAELLLEELGADEYIDPDKRVRTLSMKELIVLTKAWRRWPFKPQHFQFQNFVENNDGKDRSAFPF